TLSSHSPATSMVACMCSNCRHPDSRQHNFSTVLRWRTLIARTRSGGLMTACTRPECTGRVVDGYCDVCGSPAGAAPFVPTGSAASAASPAPSDEPGLTAVPAWTQPASGPPKDRILDLPWSTKATDWIDIQESREVEAALRRLIEPAVANTASVEPAVADLVE